MGKAAFFIVKILLFFAFRRRRISKVFWYLLYKLID